MPALSEGDHPVANSSGGSSVASTMMPWGFHVHMEVEDENQFNEALVIQRACLAYLTQRDVPITASDSFRPGYGPHLGFMWEIRVEHLPAARVFDEFGAALAWMAVNRCGLPAYVHPVMHDAKLPVMELLRDEGNTNQQQAAWFGHKVPQRQDFFFNPPLDADTGLLLDTRTPRVIPADEVNERRALGQASLAKRCRPTSETPEAWSNGLFQDPAAVIIRGFHIHVDFNEPSVVADKSTDDRLASASAETLFAGLVAFMAEASIAPSSTRRYGRNENGPHVWEGWEFKLEVRGPQTIPQLGRAIAWLMAHRSPIHHVFAHAVTWEEGDFVEELRAHEDCGFFVGTMPAMRLDFFRELMAKAAAEQSEKAENAMAVAVAIANQ